MQARLQVHPKPDTLLVNHTVYAKWGQIWWQIRVAGKGQSLLSSGERERNEQLHMQTTGLNPKLHLRDSPISVYSHWELLGVDTKGLSSLTSFLVLLAKQALQ